MRDGAGDPLALSLSKQRLKAILIVFLLFLPLAGPAIPQERSKSVESRYSTVLYSSDEDIAEFVKRLGAEAAYLERDQERAASALKARLDRIVFRVRTILEMYPQSFHFKIVVLKTYGDLKDHYRESGKTGGAPIAFFSTKTRTIYVALEKISDRILAHEIAHAVINAYFDVPPPEQAQEILAQYVDKHLWDE